MSGQPSDSDETEQESDADQPFSNIESIDMAGLSAAAKLAESDAFDPMANINMTGLSAAAKLAESDAFDPMAGIDLASFNTEIQQAIQTPELSDLLTNIALTTPTAPSRRRSRDQSSPNIITETSSVYKQHRTPEWAIEPIAAASELLTIYLIESTDLVFENKRRQAAASLVLSAFILFMVKPQYTTESISIVKTLAVATWIQQQMPNPEH